MARDDHPDYKDCCECPWCVLRRALDNLAEHGAGQEQDLQTMAAALVELDSAGLVPDLDQYHDALTAARTWNPPVSDG